MPSTEIFTNNASTTVSSGGTTAPASGTIETWTVASSASFPAASSVLGRQFHVADPALPTEKIKVAHVAGTTWTVTRGAEGTTPVAHSAGFTVVQVVTAGGLGAFEQEKSWQFRVEDYGAVGDGKVVADVATTSGSKVITSASAAFTQADVGKKVMINGANGTTDVPQVDTIASVQSATQATLTTNNAGATATGCQMVWGTDDTAAIKAAVDAAGVYALANTYFAEVVFAAKVYMLASGPTQVGNGSSTPTFNAQIPVPYPAADGTSRKLVIALTGAGDAGFVEYWMSTTPNLAGTVLVSTLTAPSTPDATFGIQSVVGGPSGSAGYGGGYANTKVSVEGIEVVCGVYTNLYAYDFGYLSAIHVDKSSAHTFAPSGVNGGTGPLLKDLRSQVAFQNKIGVGLRSPVNGNNADVTVPSFTSEGYPRALAIWDHFTGGRIFTFYNDVAIRIDTALGVSGTNHAITIEQLGAEAYNGGILAIGSGGAYVPVYITMDAETPGAGLAYDISDSGNILHGLIHWTDPISGRNVVVTGAGNVEIIDDTRNRGTMTAPAVPATGVASTPVYRHATVQVTGGTVTQIAIDGVNTGLTSGMFRLPSGKTMAITYSSVPTWRWWLD